jgi:hypothetical protein
MHLDDRCKVQVYSRLIAGMVGSKPVAGVNFRLFCLLGVFYVTVFATICPPVQRSPTDCYNLPIHLAHSVGWMKPNLHGPLWFVCCEINKDELLYDLCPFVNLKNILCDFILF